MVTDVFPASAGVIRIVDTKTEILLSIPRVSGGDPCEKEIMQGIVFPRVSGGDP